MSKHTPGPWAASGSSILPVGSGASGVAAILSHRAEWRDNARLIAAAPNMLAALKEARHALRWVLNTPQMAASDRAAAEVALADVEAAIANAVLRDTQPDAAQLARIATNGGAAHA